MVNPKRQRIQTTDYMSNSKLFYLMSDESTDINGDRILNILFVPDERISYFWKSINVGEGAFTADVVRHHGIRRYEVDAT